MALSVVAIKAAKSREKTYKLSDSDGLYLLVAPSGARYWRMNYRHLGKQKTLAFGVWPDTGLAEARAARDTARKVLALGDDPAERTKLDRIAATVAASNSFKAVADEWLLKVEKEGRSAVTMKKLRWLLTFINASIGKRPVASISAQELLLMLRRSIHPVKAATRSEILHEC
ncbi:tyrosine-type recombinase/integrase [Sphingomonas hengshuiensis]|uniref:tyrosine-type recombinase/integrase n=1 Tax=Sphingomonas hengshuiensis TaxID=1609977 RepID=UPI000A746C2C|nr:integrase arm-type DNA-binding domain-containing protein [Sphingomonas hengshuiensis]